MKYAKLIDDEIVYAKNPLEIDGNYVFTNDFSQYGYKPVEIPEMPTQEGYYAVPDGFNETETEIVQKWKLEPLTPEMEIAECKAKLEATKDKVIDFMEGVITEEEYAPIKAEREALRERIRELENE